MSPVSSPSYTDYYSKLPLKDRKELAEATGKKSAYTSTQLLLNKLKTPAVVKALPKDQFESKINKESKIKFWTRTGLAFRHYFNALFSRFDSMGKDFAALVRGKKAGKNPPGATNRIPARRSALTGWRSRLVDIATSAFGSGIGNWIANLFTHNKDNDENAAADGNEDAANGTEGSEESEKAEDADKTTESEESDNDRDDTASEVDDDDDNASVWSSGS